MNTEKQSKGGKFVGKNADVTDKILQAFFKVHSVLGYGFSEKVYQNALAIELAKLGLQAEHEAQLLNYLKATTIEVGLLLNFGPKAEFKRKVYDNARKGSLAWTQP